MSKICEFDTLLFDVQEVGVDILKKKEVVLNLYHEGEK